MKTLMLILLVCLFLASCQKETLPEVELFSVTEITPTSANVNISVRNSDMIFMFVNDRDPVLLDAYNYSNYKMAGLIPNKVYNLKLFAFYEGSNVARDFSFKTNSSSLSITAFSVSDITSVSAKILFSSTSDFAITSQSLKNEKTGELISLTVDSSDLGFAIIKNLLPNTEYAFTLTVKDNTGNVATASQTFKTAEQFAVINLADSYEASAKATDKVLFGRSVAKAFVLDVLIGGRVDIDVLGATNNGTPAVSHYWINSEDNPDINVACSTLGSKVPKTSITSKSFKLNLSVGKNVVCFKTVAYAGQIEDGGNVGLRIKGENFLFENFRYIVDGGENVAGVISLKFVDINNSYYAANSEKKGSLMCYFRLYPYSSENETVYDGNLYPKILNFSVDPSDISLFTLDTNVNYNNLDFTNAKGTSGTNLRLVQAPGSSGLPDIDLFNNAQANFSVNKLEFRSQSGIQMYKSLIGNFTDVKLHTNVYNNGAEIVLKKFCWAYKSVRFTGNPEVYVYNMNGVRIN